MGGKCSDGCGWRKATHQLGCSVITRHAPAIPRRRPRSLAKLDLATEYASHAAGSWYRGARMTGRSSNGQDSSLADSSSLITGGPFYRAVRSMGLSERRRTITRVVLWL